MKALIIAEGCNPDWTSVPLLGWFHSQALAAQKGLKVHLVTQIRNREALINQGLSEGSDFTAIDSEALARPFYKVASLLRGGEGKGWTTITAFEALAYPYFEHLVWKTFKARLTAGEFDIVHRIVPVTPTAPSPLARHCAKLGIPFILGPLNGGVPWPKEFEEARRKEKEWLSYVRGIYTLLPGYRSTRQYATAIIAGSQYTLAQIPAKYQHKCFYIPENAIDPKRFPIPKEKNKPTLPLKAAFVGRLVPYKGCDMLLEAAAPFIRQGQMQLDIYGSGPELDNLQTMISKLDIIAGTKIHGFVPHSQLHTLLGKADVLTFPSIREFGGGVVLEAMALGVTPVIVDYGGPAELVNAVCGYTIPIGSRDYIITKLGEILAEIIATPEVLIPKSKASIERIHNLFTWKAKAKQVFDIYQWAMRTSEEKPQPEF